MPELPEVETTIRGLRKHILNQEIKDVFLDAANILKKPNNFNIFRKKIINKKIKEIKRRGKNILIVLDNNSIILAHQKISGHLLVGKWDLKNWQPKIKGPLSEPINRFIHFLIVFKTGLMLALSDVRKFAKIELWESSKELENSKEFKLLGPEPLEKDFTFNKFKERLKNKKGLIKKVLMDQAIVAGIGNIYSDEILWRARINPFKRTNLLKKDEIKEIYKYIKIVLKRAIELKGESFSDYRTPDGKKGFFDRERKAYQRTGEKCSRCKEKIIRKKIGARSTHYCPRCQKI
ncbi:MAG: DNA-formamidopyrimidine glycosylase [bacterium]|nr:DNA-formamidopyrimidine glycosylase [bacterium]